MFNTKRNLSPKYFRGMKKYKNQCKVLLTHNEIANIHFQEVVSNWI